MKDDFAKNYTVRKWFREIRRIRKRGASARWTRNANIVAAVILFMNGLIYVRLHTDIWVWAGHFLGAVAYLVAGLTFSRRQYNSIDENGENGFGRPKSDQADAP